MWRPRLVASSSAVRDDSRPTESGASAWGKRTASRRGIRGRDLRPRTLIRSPAGSVWAPADFRPCLAGCVDSGLDRGLSVTYGSCKLRILVVGIPGGAADKPEKASPSQMLPCGGA